MQGFSGRTLPMAARRALTLVPAVLVLALGVDPTRALVLSQVVLSFGLPFVLVPLVLLTRRPDLMRELVNRRTTTALASLVVAVIVVLNAAVFAQDPGQDATLPGLHAGLATVGGPVAAGALAVALLASGFASTGVGTLSGQVVMQGFSGRTLPMAARRALTLVPAVLVLALGVDPTRALVLSQVVLSFGLPFVLVPLVLLTRRADLMRELVNRRTTTVLAALVVGVIVVLNAMLIVLTLH